MTETEKAWVAGIIDGEGCITAFLQQGGIKGRLQVLMVHKPTIKRLHELTGEGNVYKHSHTLASGRSGWLWIVSSQKARRVLSYVLPYMITKRNQAELYIKLMEMREGDKSRIEGRPNYDKQLEIMATIRAEKKVGFD